MVLLGVLAAPAAARLLSPARARTNPLDGVDGLQTLAVDGAALARLRERDRDLVRDVPLGRGRAADLELERFEPFAAGARAEVMENGKRRRLRLPDHRYFRGRVRGEPDSHVLLIAGRSRVHGFVVSGGDVYPFGPDGRGRHRTYALRDADPTRHPRPGDFCTNDLEPGAVHVPAAELAVTPAVAAAPETLKQADIALETDQELRAKFASDGAALDYLASLAAAATSIYERDVAVRLRFSYIRLWGASTPDPWSASSTSASLGELRSYWNAPSNDMARIAGPRTVVHFLSGKAARGGVAYVNVLCNQSYGYGVSQVNGAFDLSRPAQIWDVVVFTHELGHNFGSPHTHCYDPPIDRCYASESGCYSGPTVASRGTIMSYCHLNGGLGNLNLLFGDVVSGRIGQSVATAGCLATVPASSTTTTTTRPPTTTRAPTTTTTRPSATSTTTVRPTSTTSTTAPSSGDADGDGVSDASDACPGTPADELVNPAGCSVCPCAGPSGGESWPSRLAYLRCVRTAARDLLAVGRLDDGRRRAALEHTRRSSCGRPAATRCCVFGSATAGSGRCRVLRREQCAGRADTLDVGPGSCVSFSCVR
jgi:hypothetical protein